MEGTKGRLDVNDDIVKSLEGADFSCNDIVTFLVKIEMKDTFAADPALPLTARMSFSFTADTTGQSGVALSRVEGVSINYSPDHVLGFTQDTAMSDDEGSEISMLTAADNIMPVNGKFTSGAELLLTIEVTDLEPSEVVIVRIDTRLECKPDSDPTGNLQGNLKDVIDVTTDQAAGSGAQTINFKTVTNIEGAGEPLLEIFKTVTTATGSCPGQESLEVNTGEIVKYCFEVFNYGTADLYNLVITDDLHTPEVPGDDVVVTLMGLTDEDGDGTLDDLGSGESLVASLTYTFSEQGDFQNTVHAKGDNGLSGGNFETLNDDDSAIVTVNPAPCDDSDGDGVCDDSVSSKSYHFLSFYVYIPHSHPVSYHNTRTTAPQPQTPIKIILMEMLQVMPVTNVQMIHSRQWLASVDVVLKNLTLIWMVCLTVWMSAQLILPRQSLVSVTVVLPMMTLMVMVLLIVMMNAQMTPSRQLLVSVVVVWPTLTAIVMVLLTVMMDAHMILPK